MSGLEALKGYDTMSTRIEFRLADKIAAAEADLARAESELRERTRMIGPAHAALIAAAAQRYADCSARLMALQSVRGD